MTSSKEFCFAAITIDKIKKIWFVEHFCVITVKNNNFKYQLLKLNS